MHLTLTYSSTAKKWIYVLNRSGTSFSFLFFFFRINNSTRSKNLNTQMDERNSAMRNILVGCIVYPLNSTFRFYNTFCSKCFPYIMNMFCRFKLKLINILGAEFNGFSIHCTIILQITEQPSSRCARAWILFYRTL